MQVWDLTRTWCSSRGPGRCRPWSSFRGTRLPNNHEVFVADLPAGKLSFWGGGITGAPRTQLAPSSRKSSPDHLLTPSFLVSSSVCKKLLLSCFCLSDCFLRRLHFFLDPGSWGPPGKTQRHRPSPSAFPPCPPPPQGWEGRNQVPRGSTSLCVQDMGSHCCLPDPGEPGLDPRLQKGKPNGVRKLAGWPGHWVRKN